jgi:hypothetical protein
MQVVQVEHGADDETHGGLETAAPMQVEHGPTSDDETRTGLETAGPMQVVPAEDGDAAQDAGEKEETPPSGTDTPTG